MDPLGYRFINITILIILIRDKLLLIPYHLTFIIYDMVLIITFKIDTI